MGGSLAGEMSPNPQELSEQEMSFDSRQWSDGSSDHELLPDPSVEDDISEAHECIGPEIVRLKSYGEKGPSTVRVLFEDAEAEVCM